MPVKGGATLDDRVFRELRAKLAKMRAGRAHVKVGVLSADSHGGGDISMVELAAIHEFGAPAAGIPERSFIRSTFRHEGVRSGLTRMLTTVARGIIAEKLEIKEALDKVGAWAAAAVKKTIKDKQTTGPEPQENKQSTIDKKGSSTPLIDTGQLINSITWEAVER